MTDSLPTWVTKRDGRLVPFEADKISRALFAATEAIERPDTFLARELTDGVLHFLAAEAGGSIPTTTQVAEVVEKVVRELGHPALAQAFARHAEEPASEPLETPPPQPSPQGGGRNALPPSLDHLVEAGAGPHPLAWQISRAYLRGYSLREVYARDLVAAHEEGLLTLGNLDAPFELAGTVLGPPEPPAGLLETIGHARAVAGDWIAIDSPEYLLADAADLPAATAGFVRELRLGLEANGLRGIVNLNCASPPAWAGELAEGPLFAGGRPPAGTERLDHIRESLAEQLLLLDGMRVDWHLNDRDFAAAPGRLQRLARRAVEGAPLTFVFDRPRGGVPLAEGADRKHPAVLLTAGLNLYLLARQPRLGADPDLFLRKLGSLARLAISAAAQKRDFLRRQAAQRPALTRGFLLDRARLVVVPIGLEKTVRVMHAHGLADGAPPLETGRQIIARLRDELRREGAARHLDTALDSADLFTMTPAADQPAGDDTVAGLTSWAPPAPPRQQLKAAGVLHAAAEGGTAALLLPADRMLSAQEAAELLQFAGQQTGTVRVRFWRVRDVPHQMMARWEG